MKQAVFGVFVLYFFVSTFRHGNAFAQAPQTLPPVDVNASESALGFEQRRATAKTSPAASGNISSALLRNKNVPLTRSGSAPGANAQLRGYGLSSEETTVSVSGWESISLNPAQGGGFDLSSFPAFFWESAHFELSDAPALRSDTRGLGPELELRPWAQPTQNGETQGPRTEALASHSTLQFQQWAARTRSASKAAVAGYSSGRLKGPALGLSGVVNSEAGPRVRFDLLGSDLESSSPGPRSGPTPDARSRSERLIGALALQSQDWTWGVYADGLRLRYNDPQSAFSSQNTTVARGTLVSWRPRGQAFQLRARARNARYQSVSEWNAAFDVEDGFEFGSQGRWRVRPGLTVLGVQRLGVAPEPRVRVERDLDARRTLTWLTDVSIARRVPSLVDRFYVSPFFRPNGALKADWAGRVRSGFSWNAWDHALVIRSGVSLQERPRVSVSERLSALLTTVSPSGRARTVQWDAELRVQQVVSSARVYVEWGGSLQSARLIDRAQDVPYIPRALGVTELGAELQSAKLQWGVWMANRVSTRYQTALGGGSLPGYGLVDAGFRFGGGGCAGTLQLAIENLTNRPIELVQDYPIAARSFVFSLQWIL